jgi:DNA (cytosine-5)-methyltransferase 1
MTEHRDSPVSAPRKGLCELQRSFLDKTENSQLENHRPTDATVTRPRLLDLYCGAGGAARGYHDLGFDVVGVDHKPQPRYPYLFVQADAIEFAERNARHFDAIHASPPCQRFTALKSVFDSSKYEDLVEPTRDVLAAAGRPSIMENVVGAPLRRDLILCGAPFGLRTYRHRIFELSFPVEQPAHPKHTMRVNRRSENRREHWQNGGFVTVVGDIGSYVGPDAMGIDWMTGAELSQAIPPAYTRYIGWYLLAHLSAAKVAA